ncbi:hypothetical protein MLD38_000145 [Melastoma candidum]|uniref:Uncharacterized protein n=1 Tax=Melastoma candidum TaxID=119954 RepID=A0ACB9SAF7_9MYRT|nr:hypothetical protein MLD38_000145 [Melastoma candidum]
MTTPITMTSFSAASHKGVGRGEIVCRKKDRDRKRDRDGNYPYKVVEITPPPRSLGVRCFPQNLQCGESVTIEGQAYTISSVTHRYKLRKGKYEPSEKRLDVLSTGRFLILCLNCENAIQLCRDYDRVICRQ